MWEVEVGSWTIRVHVQNPSPSTTAGWLRLVVSVDNFCTLAKCFQSFLLHSLVKIIQQKKFHIVVYVVISF